MRRPAFTFWIIATCCWRSGTANRLEGRAAPAGWWPKARRRGLPLAWVHAGNARAGSRESLSLGDEQGVVTLERFPKRNLGVDVRPVP